MLKFQRAAGLLAVLALSACGGGGGGGSSSPSYNTLLQQQVNFIDKYRDASGYDDITPVAAMPSAGSASYEGTGTFLTEESGQLTPTAAGRARLVADFDGGVVSGNVTNFKAAPGNQTTGGNINVNGSIYGNYVSGTMDGNVNLNGTNHGIDEFMEGGFLGSNADGIILLSEGQTDKGTDFMVGVTAEK